MKGGRKRVKGEGVSERTIVKRGREVGAVRQSRRQMQKAERKENIEKGKGGAERHNERGRKRETIVAIGRESE